MDKEEKAIFGNYKNYLRYMSRHNLDAFLTYIDRYKRIPK